MYKESQVIPAQATKVDGSYFTKTIPCTEPQCFYFPSREYGKSINTYLIPINLALATRSGSQISLLHPVSKATFFVTYVGCLTSTTGHCMQKTSGTDNSEINFQQGHSLEAQKVSFFYSTQTFSNIKIIR